MIKLVSITLQRSCFVSLPCSSEPIIRFIETKFSVSEPKEAGAVATVRIPVVRVGDTSKVSVVRVHTKDGSAVSGEDYYPVSQGTAVFKHRQRWRAGRAVVSRPSVGKKKGSIRMEKAQTPFSREVKRCLFWVSCSS